MEVSKCWQLVEFPKISIEMKNCKTFYEGQAASRVKEIIQPLHHPSSQPDKSSMSLEQKFSYGDIKKNTNICFQRASRIQFLGVKKWCSANAFLTPNRKMLAEKFEKSFWLCCESILFLMSSELRFKKWVRFFEQNCIVKWVNFLASFCWLRDFLLEN